MGKTFIVLDEITVASGEFNEDSYGYTDNKAWVLDGSTSLTSNNLAGHNDDVTVYVERITRELLSGKSLVEAELIARNYFRGLVGSRELTTEEFPSSCLAMVEIIGNELKISMLADCSVFIKKTDGTIYRPKDTKLDILNAISLNKMRECLGKGLTIKESFKEALSILIENRRKKNVSGGYNILSEDFTEDMLISQSIKIDEVVEVLLCSDGFSALQEYKYMSDIEFYNYVTTNGIDEVVKEIKDIETIDYNCTEHLRFKQHDDITALLLEVK